MLRKTIVETGAVEGLPAADPRITAFKGIPYAAPPVGENRWRAPQPAAKWEGTFKAYKFGPISMQHIPGLDKDNLYSREWNVDPEIEMGEDCLTLNVWTPACSADEKLPVFVWYFGGGLQEGNTAEMEFDGERIARRGIVVVTVNYRLNCFGFLCHPEITKEAPEACANFGYLDQRYGTMWVKRNIAAFGGDPENITIGGQSAGGGSVVAQVNSPLNKGLFQKAIVDSGLMITPYGNGMFGPPKSLAQCEQIGVEFFEKLGVKTLAEARKLDAVFIRDKMVELGMRFPVPVDGHFMVGRNEDLLLRNECNQVPMMFGHTGSEFPMKPSVKNFEELDAFAREYFGEDADEFLSIISSKTGSFVETMYKATVQHLEYAVRMVGQQKKLTGNKMPVYYWVFDPEIPGWDDPGSFHSSDLWFFFENLAKCWRPFKGKHFDLARQMCNYWCNFIKNGDPNGPDNDGEPMPLWKPYTDDERNRMFFGDAAVPDTRQPSELMKFFMKQGEKKYS